MAARVLRFVQRVWGRGSAEDLRKCLGEGLGEGLEECPGECLGECRREGLGDGFFSRT